MELSVNKLIISSTLVALAIIGVNYSHLNQSVTIQGTTLTRSDAYIACANLAESDFVVRLGGVKADSPCGKMLGL